MTTSEFPWFYLLLPHENLSSSIKNNLNTQHIRAMQDTESVPYRFYLLQSLSRVQLFVTPWTTARQASLSFTISQTLLILMCIESVMPSNHLILHLLPWY